MFNLFKKKETLISERPNTKNYPKEVLEIHHEFEIASEKLLETAYSIINSQPTVNISKVERLKQFGFNQVKEVQESVEVIEATKLSKEQIELVQYYKQNYPFNKFITEPQVKEICHKYNLVCGDVNRFRGFVPEVNINDIERFKLKDKDIIVQGECWGKRSERYTHSISLFQYNELLSKKLIRGDGEGNLEMDDNWCHGKEINIDSEYFDRIHKPKLQICAPVKDMDISGLELREGYKLEKKFIPDPIVLQPVNGGYLIITAWGDEASDSLVVNENFN